MVLRLVTASANADKVAEISLILAAANPDLILLPRPAEVPEVIEDADTLLGNALLKARALCVATGLGAIADDTGLFVDALGGAPGVYSARYAGDNATYADNCHKLLAALNDHSLRTASFRTVAAIAWPDGTYTSAEGRVDGVIALHFQGEGGFGYDPLFLPDEGGGLSFAQMGMSAKNAISHRGRALRALAVLLDPASNV
jgi:XTP/dITP diphosphohydrolase